MRLLGNKVIVTQAMLETARVSVLLDQSLLQSLELPDQLVEINKSNSIKITGNRLIIQDKRIVMSILYSECYYDENDNMLYFTKTLMESIDGKDYKSLFIVESPEEGEEVFIENYGVFLSCNYMNKFFEQKRVYKSCGSYFLL